MKRGNPFHVPGRELDEAQLAAVHGGDPLVLDLHLAKPPLIELSLRRVFELHIPIPDPPPDFILRQDVAIKIRTH